jgi:hypothetical protein
MGITFLTVAKVFRGKRHFETVLLVLLFFILSSVEGGALGLSLDFFDFPKETASLFRSQFSLIEAELAGEGDGSAKLFIYYDGEKDIYKASLIMGLDRSIFGVDERRVKRDTLDLRPYAPYFLVMADYLEAVRYSTADTVSRKLISKMVMSIILVNEKGDTFEFFGDTDFFLGVREAIISPNFIFLKNSRGVIHAYMEPTAIVSQVFILPSARDPEGALAPMSLIYDFFFFEY